MPNQNLPSAAFTSSEALMVSTAEAAVDLHIPHQLFPNCRSCRAFPSVGLSGVCGKKLSLRHSHHLDFESKSSLSNIAGEILGMCS